MINSKDFKYLNVHTCVPRVYPGQPRKNTDEIIDCIDEILKNKDDYADIIVFPEMSITGYTCGDLFLCQDIINSVPSAIRRISKHLELNTRFHSNKSDNILIVVGAPVQTTSGKIYNAAIAISYTCIYIMAKKHLPNYSEFYEKRWFDTPNDNNWEVNWEDLNTIIVHNNVIESNQFKIGFEICEDLWAPKPSSEDLVLNYGADVIINLSASPELAGKEKHVEKMIESISSRLICGYVYVSAGPSESSTDLVFSGWTWVYENGKNLNSGQPNSILERYITHSLIDIDEIKCYRRKNKTFTNSLNIDSTNSNSHHLFRVDGGNNPSSYYILNYLKKPRIFDSHPFVDPANYSTVFSIQVKGLQSRLINTGIKDVVIGVSGGTDSTLALLVCHQAYIELGYDTKLIHGITMPCFGTTSRTKDNSIKLMNILGISSEEIDITKSVTEHLTEMGHPLDVTDIAYENAQARTRTMTLFDKANMIGGALVIGTGDLSELALGWCTYGADHLSSYCVNGSVPKTLVKLLIDWYANSTCSILRNVLMDILGTPISPELLPPDSKGNIKQVSEDTVGPYELHDYFLYHFIRTGWSCKKIFITACIAFEGTYDYDTIKKWLQVFLKRFASQQFKRSCLPDGPKTGSISLSPRGDWRMPSDVVLDDFKYNLIQ